MNKIFDGLIDIKDRRFKVFLVSFIAGFLMVVMPHLGVKPVKISLFDNLNFFKNISLITPVPKETDPLDKIKARLLQKENQFSLNKPTSLVKAAIATSDYQEANAYAVIDYDTGDVIASKNLSEKISIASITKVMTAVVALDLTSKDELFTVSVSATKATPTRLALSPGDKLTLEELLNALLLTSANDTAQVIKEGIDERFGTGVFIRAMNEKAKVLGLKNTSFQNPAGFDSKTHYSSPEDVSILSHYALANYPLISEIVKKDHSELYSNDNHERYEWLNNWNGLIGVYPGAYGIKIGNTGRAGHTTSVVAERDGKKVLAVLLGAPGVLERDLWASELLDVGFSKWGIEPADITEDELREKYATWKYSRD